MRRELAQAAARSASLSASRELPSTVNGGSIRSECGVLKIRGAERDSETWMLYRAETARWLVVSSRNAAIPLGCTAEYPDHLEELAQSQEIKVKPPDWHPVLYDAELQAAVEAAEWNLESKVSRLLAGKAMECRTLLLLLGPPCSGKTTLARREPSWGYDQKALLVLDQVIAECSRFLFRKLCLGREGAKTDPYELEAFLVESLRLYQSFQDVARKILWDPERGALARALEGGVGIAIESHGDNSSVADIKYAVGAARAAGYRVLVAYTKAAPLVLRRRCEERFERELLTCEMLGGRHFDALVDRLAEASCQRWEELRSMSDESKQVVPDPCEGLVTTM